MPHSSAMLEVKSTGKGFLPPRMTQIEMNAISGPAQGLLVYNTDANALFWYNGSSWKRFIDTYTETDPIFAAHPANGITSGLILNWNSAYSNRIVSVSGAGPLSLSLTANVLTGSITAAGDTANGFLTSADWNTFNNKISSPWIATPQHISYNSGNVGIGTSAPVPSAALEVTSTNSGVLLPRMTRAQRNAIAFPSDGLMVYCTNCGTTGSLSIFTSGSWMTFSPCMIAAPSAGTPIMSQGQIIWNWQPVPGASGYKWNTSTDYETAIDMSSTTTKTETGTICGTTYSRYVWAYGGCGESAMTTLTTTVPAAVPGVPVAATNVALPTSIVWNWNTVPNAIGYKWNSINDYTLATDLASATTKTETGLICGTSYTRYVWAYNGCGYSTSVTLTQVTADCWICGLPIVKNHISAGGVAPVDKTVTYGTVTNVPGETSKCWITQNLGATQQATTVSDATELSAGWYWQFNRKQGYMHDGINRTPNTVWNSAISESSDWTIASDPCAIELGAGWRIPTNTEWTNVDGSGGWINWNGPYASLLKMHAAGYLNISGTLDNRGVYGTYWSSTQSGATTGLDLYFVSSASNMTNGGKSYGFSLRCIR